MIYRTQTFHHHWHLEKIVARHAGLTGHARRNQDQIAAGQTPETANRIRRWVGGKNRSETGQKMNWHQKIPPFEKIPLRRFHQKTLGNKKKTQKTHSSLFGVMETITNIQHPATPWHRGGWGPRLLKVLDRLWPNLHHVALHVTLPGVRKIIDSRSTFQVFLLLVSGRVVLEFPRIRNVWSSWWLNQPISKNMLVKLGIISPHVRVKIEIPKF